jgi:hypothetical protein
MKTNEGTNYKVIEMADNLQFNNMIDLCRNMENVPKKDSCFLCQ